MGENDLESKIVDSSPDAFESHKILYQQILVNRKESELRKVYNKLRVLNKRLMYEYCRSGRADGLELRNDLFGDPIDFPDIPARVKDLLPGVCERYRRAKLHYDKAYAEYEVIFADHNKMIKN